jgi:glycosyltransferase involved in cell wall biosynthesis
MKSVVVIPAYDEARTIRELVQRVLACCPEVVVVDDGSRDGTGEAVAGLGATLLRHEINRGKAAALATGFEWALARGAEAVVTLDGDGQHRPEDIPRLLAAAETYPGRLVIGARLFGRQAYPRARNFANAFADFWVAWAAGHPLADSQSGQRVYPARLLRAVADLHERSRGFTFESEVVIRAALHGFTTVAVPIGAIHHVNGRRSHFRPLRDTARIVAMIAGYLLRSGLNPRGLWRSLRKAPCIVDDPATALRGVADARKHGVETSPGQPTTQISLDSRLVGDARKRG